MAYKTLEEFNAQFNDETYPLYPFIKTSKITILKKGLYRKFKANFRGVSAVFDKITENYTYPLYGMFNVPEDLVIVPEGMKLSKKDSALLNSFLSQGYKQSTTPPRFSNFYYETNSEAAKLALENKMKFSKI